MSRRVLAAWLAGAPLLMLLVGCSSTGDRATEPNSPTRVVTLAPAAAEMLEALDLLDRVVGIGEFGPWPEELGELPVAGGYSSPNKITQVKGNFIQPIQNQETLSGHQCLTYTFLKIAGLKTGQILKDLIADALRQFLTLPFFG